LAGYTSIDQVGIVDAYQCSYLAMVSTLSCC